MIDPKELRIGNLVYHQDVHFKEVPPKVLDVDWEFFTADFWANESTPIPLTPEWLERMGFEKYNEVFFKIKDSEGWFLNNDGEITKSLSDFYVRCKSLHQLQNLYFALTGEELNIKNRLNLERKIGRLLTDNEVAHHKNGIKTDNRKSNLEVLTHSEHIKHHANERRRNKQGKFK